MRATRTDRLAAGKPVLSKATLGSALLALLFAFATPEAGGERMYRCVGENGEPIFSDRPCGASVKAPSEVDTAPSDPTAQSGPSVWTPGPPRTCALSAEALRMRVEEAMAAQSGIDLSGLILWDASARGPDVALLRDLGALSREELVAVDLDVFGPMEGMDPYGNRERSAPDIELVVHTIRLDKAKVPFPDWFRFAVIEQGGCWWLRIP